MTMKEPDQIPFTYEYKKRIAREKIVGGIIALLFALICFKSMNYFANVLGIFLAFGGGGCFLDGFFSYLFTTRE